MFDIKEYLEKVIEEVRAKRKRVVRGGKRIRKKSCPSGYKLVGGKCVRMKASEKRRRSRSQRKGARKRKAKSSSITRKRNRSIRRRR